MSAFASALRAIATTLAKKKLRWYLFGAQAVAVHGAPRATQDIDITVEIAEDELSALLDELRRQGLTLRYPDKFQELLEAGAVIPMQHPSGMDVDIVIAGTGLEQLALGRAQTVVIEEISVPVVSATDLVVMKVVAGRGKDLDDVRGILAAGEVDIGEARDLLHQIEDALERSDLVEALDTAVAEVE